MPSAGPQYLSSDFHDDGEAGSGRVLLQMLEERGLTDICVFVVRKYGGVKIGADRFKLYKEVVREVIDPNDMLFHKRQELMAAKRQDDIDVTDDNLKMSNRQPHDTSIKEGQSQRRGDGRKEHYHGTRRGFAPYQSNRTARGHGYAPPGSRSRGHQYSGTRGHRN